MRETRVNACGRCSFASVFFLLFTIQNLICKLFERIFIGFSSFHDSNSFLFFGCLCTLIMWLCLFPNQTLTHSSRLTVFTHDMTTEKKNVFMCICYCRSNLYVLSIVQGFSISNVHIFSSLGICGMFICVCRIRFKRCICNHCVLSILTLWWLMWSGQMAVLNFSNMALHDFRSKFHDFTFNLI